MMESHITDISSLKGLQYGIYSHIFIYLEVDDHFILSKKLYVIINYCAS